MRNKLMFALAAAALAVSGCASSPTNTPAAPSAASSEASAAMLTETSTAEEVAAALDCTGYAPAPEPTNTAGTMGPAPVSEGSCSVEGKPWTVTVYASNADLMSVLLLVKMWVGGTITKPISFAVGDTWILAPKNTDDPIPDTVKIAVELNGGIIKTLEPSSTL